MRRLALLAAALAVACSSKSGSNPPPSDVTPPVAPEISVPAAGAYLTPGDLTVRGEVVFSGTAEPGATVAVQVEFSPSGPAAAAGSVVAASDGTWSVGVSLAGGAYVATATATDAAGNTSEPSAQLPFTLDEVRFATAVPSSWPYLSVTSWGQAVPVTPRDASGLGELFPGQANSWVLDRDFSLAAGYGLEYAHGLVLYTGAPTSPTSHASLLGDLLASALAQFPGDQAFSEATFLEPTVSGDDGVASIAVDDGLSMGLPAISGTSSAFLNGTASSVLGGYLLQFDPAETYTFGWTHQAVLRAGLLAGADQAPDAPSYQVVLRTTGSPYSVIGEPLFSSSADVVRATESVTRSGLPQYAVLQFELRSAADGYAELDDLTLSDSTGPIALRNPGFENGFDGWATALSGGGSQNVRSGARDVGAAGSALTVTRTFYAPPAAAWGRMVDVFENAGATDVTTKVVYVTLLGGQSTLAAVTQGGRAVVAWDRDATVRDVGICFGTGTAYVADGSPFVFVTHDLTVPAGGKAALVHFVVQLGETAGGANAALVPQGTDDACGAILVGYPSLAVPTYRLWLEPGVGDAVANL